MRVSIYTHSQKLNDDKEFLLSVMENVTVVTIPFTLDSLILNESIFKIHLKKRVVTEPDIATTIPSQYENAQIPIGFPSTQLDRDVQLL